MPTFQIRVINTHYDNSNKLDLPSAEEARAEALKSALQIGVEEVCNGTPFFGAEVRVESDGKVHDRLVVAIGVSPLR